MIPPHDFTYTGAKDTPVDERDYKLLGATGAIPKVFMQEKAWQLPVHYQRDIPACGAHAGVWLKMLIDEYEDNGNNYTPRFSWVKIKQFDGYPPEDGTDMRSIFKSLEKHGALDFEPFGNDTRLSLKEYTDPRNVTPFMDERAYPNRIATYGFAQPESMEHIKRLIYLNKGVLILMRIGKEFWTDKRGRVTWDEDKILPLRQIKNIVSGHFVVAHSYDEKYIYFYNMWSDKWGRNGHGYFDVNYLPFVNQLGTISDYVEVPEVNINKFFRDLYVGITGDDVRLLQQYLNKKGFTIATKGAGSPGNETTYYGPLTEAAVAHLQRANGISPSRGYFGPKTRAFVNQNP